MYAVNDLIKESIEAEIKMDILENLKEEFELHSAKLAKIALSPESNWDQTKLSFVFDENKGFTAKELKERAINDQRSRVESILQRAGEIALNVSW